MQEADDGKKEERAETEKKEESGAENEVAGLKDRMLRLAAEFDNYKKRVSKELSASSDKGRADIIAKLLPVIDEFELAISSMDATQDQVKGIGLIYSNFISVLKSAGLETVEVSGRYDPYKQEIVLAEESDKEEGTVLKVVRKGYMFDDMLLRPASVIIAKGKDVEQTKEERIDLEDKKDEGE